MFHEQYYLARNPDVAELVRTGLYESGFDHYCQHGWRGVSPHCLFDDTLYAELYEDVTLENLELHGSYGRYDHYLKSGQRERRIGQYLFDAPFYRAQTRAAGVAEDEIDGPGPYVHFLACLGSRRDELPPSIYFDPAWYVEHHRRRRRRFCAANLWRRSIIASPTPCRNCSTPCRIFPNASTGSATQI